MASSVCPVVVRRLRGRVWNLTFNGLYGNRPGLNPGFTDGPVAYTAGELGPSSVGPGAVRAIQTTSLRSMLAKRLLPSVTRHHSLSL
jgi:hypothetical protein